MHRFLPRFTLGSLFGVTALVAIALWWWCPGVPQGRLLGGVLSIERIKLGDPPYAPIHVTNLGSWRNSFFWDLEINYPVSYEHNEQGKRVEAEHFAVVTAPRHPRQNLSLDSSVLVFYGEDVDPIALRGSAMFAFAEVPDGFAEYWLVWLLPKPAKVIVVPQVVVKLLDATVALVVIGTSIYLLWFRGRRLAATTAMQESHTKAQNPQSS